MISTRLRAIVRHDAGAPRATSPNVAGIVSVNTEPWPGTLSTAMRAADQFGERARQRQAEPGALDLALQAIVDLGELLEDLLLILRRDADAGVAHRESRHAGLRAR